MDYDHRHILIKIFDIVGIPEFERQISIYARNAWRNDGKGRAFEMKCRQI